MGGLSRGAGGIPAGDVYADVSEAPGRFPRLGKQHRRPGMRVAGGVLAGVLAIVLGVATAVRAQPMGAPVSTTEPAGVLLMPFDLTGGKVSFELVSRPGPSPGGAPISTHWVYYAEDCRHLADVFIELTPQDTVVVDPTRLQSETQSPNPPRNDRAGPVIDLSGERGLVIVTVVVPDGEQLGDQLVGAWTIADTSTGASIGTDAIGIRSGGLPDPAVLSAGGIRIQTFDPQTLDASRILTLAVESGKDGIVPIARPAAAFDGAHVCCDVAFVDDLEIAISMPDYCFACVGFAAITAALAAEGETFLLPSLTTVLSPGFVHLTHCRSANEDGTLSEVGKGDFDQFLFAFHGQMVGPFGTVASGKYEDRLE